MSYVLPDEPRGAVRPGLAVDPVWPLLTLMLIGPLPGFVWLAFNSLALGCRRVALHLVLSVGGIIAVPLLSLLLLEATLAWFGSDHMLAFRLGIIVIQASALILALWLMMDQADAQEWRTLQGPPLGNGARLFFPLLILWLFLGSRIPAEWRFWAVWTGL